MSELCAYYIAIGVSKAEVYDSCPADLWIYDDAFRMRTRIRDAEMYRQMLYMNHAVTIAVANCFKKKGARPEKVWDKPLLEQADEQRGEMDEEEKRRKTEMLFANLRIMEANFNLNKKDKKK